MSQTLFWGKIRLVGPGFTWLLLAIMGLSLLSGCTTQPKQPSVLANHHDLERPLITAYLPQSPPEQWLYEGVVYAATRTNENAFLLEAQNYHGVLDVYHHNLQTAIEQNQAAHIGFAHQTYIPHWAAAGYIVPVDDCRQQHSQFDLIFEEAWQAATYQGQVWGIPVAISPRLLFYNKTMLRELGWSENRIETLPQEIERGDFTLANLATTATAAIRAGIVQPGFGYWEQPDKPIEFISVYLAFGGQIYDTQSEQFVIGQAALEGAYRWRRSLFTEAIMLPQLAGATENLWGTRLLQLDALTQGRVLFWTSHSFDWVDWVTGYEAREKGLDQMYKEIGYALFPAADSGIPAHIQAMPEYYVLTAGPHMTPAKEAIACALLAQTISPEVNARQAQHNGRPGVSVEANNATTDGNGRFIKEISQMLPYAWIPPVNPHYETYYHILAEFLAEVETGLLDPETAANLAIEQLQRTFEDTLRVE
jgi:inositol-phosphate transport system substrate-binding protein